MTSWFTPSERLEHVTPIPATVSPPKAIAHLHDHEFFIQSDPHMKHYELSPTPDPAPSIPEEREVVAIAEPVCYTVTDRVHTLPAGLWDSNVESTYEFLNLERGVFVRIRSPMGMLMESVWEIRESEEDGTELVEEVVITCSRLLIGVIRNTCESGWEDIHASISRCWRVYKVRIRGVSTFKITAWRVERLPQAQSLDILDYST